MSNSENQAKLHVVIGGVNHSLSKHKRKANLKSKANTVERQRDEVKTELIAAFAKVLEALNGKQVHRASEIPIYAFDDGFIETAAAALQRTILPSTPVATRASGA